MTTPTPENHPRVAGITLLEMLVVLGMISVLFGIGLGVFANLDKNLAGDIAVERLKSMLRMARNTAIRNGSPAYVILEPAHRRVIGAGAALVGQWHFEDVDGAVGGAFDPAGATIARDGRFGSCLDFGPGGGTASSEPRPAFDPRAGFFVEAYIEPRVRREMTVFDMNGSYRLVLTEDGNLFGEVSLADGSLIVAEAVDLVLPRGRWSRVGLSFTGAAVEVYLDGVQVATQLARGEVQYTPGTSLSIGAAEAPFRGRVDELRLLNLATREEAVLPADVELVGKRRVIRFDRNGKLDPAAHPGPVRVALKSPARSYSLEVGILGAVR